MKKAKPDWSVPENLQQLIDSDAGNIWEDGRWAPILLTVMGGTSYAGREISLAWQIEFQPFGDIFETANKKIEGLGIDPDGYGWSTLMQSVIAKYHPEIAEELQLGDTETDACVVWVESEKSCKILVEVAWSLIYGS